MFYLCDEVFLSDGDTGLGWGVEGVFHEDGVGTTLFYQAGTDELTDEFFGVFLFPYRVVGSKGIYLAAGEVPVAEEVEKEEASLGGSLRGSVGGEGNMIEGRGVGEEFFVGVMDVGHWWCSFLRGDLPAKSCILG